jgi:hypothetical protein
MKIMMMKNKIRIINNLKNKYRIVIIIKNANKKKKKLAQKTQYNLSIIKKIVIFMKSIEYLVYNKYSNYINIIYNITV